jgi:hypothetical protein
MIWVSTDGGARIKDVPVSLSAIHLDDGPNDRLPMENLNKN